MNTTAGELRMYIVINASARMKKGKIAAQACHAVQAVMEHMIRHHPSDWQRYHNNGMHPKVVLKAQEEQMQELEQLYQRRNAKVWCASVHDAGRTQVPANTLTALAFCPLTNDEKPDILKHLKLL